MRDESGTSPESGTRLSMNKRLGNDEGTWTFLTNHAHVLVCLARDPSMRLRDLADAIGITERAVHRIIVELEEAGYVSRAREGRRNRYVVHASKPFRHPLEAHRTVATLLELAARPRARRAAGR